VCKSWATAEDSPLETHACTRMEADSTASSHPSKELLTLAGQLRSFSSLLCGALPARALACADYHAHAKLTLIVAAPPSASDASGTSSLRQRPPHTPLSAAAVGSCHGVKLAAWLDFVPMPEGA
jgi:hypothetical protein